MYIDNKTTISAMCPYQEPCCHCMPGDTITFQTLDCYSGNLQSEQDTHKKVNSKDINPATGPVYVEGAETGDVLKVEVKKILLGKQACIRISPGSGPLGHLVKERKLKIMQVKDGFVCFHEGIRIPVSPMIGVIGTAPPGNASAAEVAGHKAENAFAAGVGKQKTLNASAAGDIEGIHNGIPGEHGSNMDCTKIKEGTTLYLPVNVPGALLAIGDLHAAMGDGEVAGCGAEISGEVTVQVSVVKGHNMPTPSLETENEFITIASAPMLDEAGQLAAEKMAGYLEQISGMTAEECVMLLSLVGNLEICQVVNPLKTARMAVPKWVLKSKE